MDGTGILLGGLVCNKGVQARATHVFADVVCIVGSAWGDVVSGGVVESYVTIRRHALHITSPADVSAAGPSVFKKLNTIHVTNEKLSDVTQ